MRAGSGAPVRERLMASILVTDSGCWEWQKARHAAGYGRICVGSRRDGTRRIVGAHRVSYEEFVGPIPEGLHIDHLCRNPPCINPAHLEPVTVRENVIVRGTGPAAGYALQTHCLLGHPFDEANTQVNKGKRYCRICTKRRNKEWRDAHPK